MEKSLKEILDEILDEVEQELEEATTTGNVAGYQTPHAFSDKGKKDKKRKKKIATALGYSVVGGDVNNINEDKFKAKGYKPKDAFGARIVRAIHNNIVASDVQDLKREGDDNAKILEKGKAFLDMAQNGIKAAFKFKYQIHPDVDFPMRKMRGSNYMWFKSREDMEKYLKTFLSDLKKLDKMISIFKKKPTLKAQDAIVKTWRREIMIGSSRTGNMADAIMQSANNGQSVYKEDINEAKVKRPVNRWLELKNDDTMHPHKKMAMGLKELKYQLREVEKFFNWYNKIKTMNELDSQNYWKRTNKHIYTIKEKLIKIAKTIQEIEK